MDIFFKTYLEQLEELHAGIKVTVQEMPQEAMDWSPGEGMNSIAVLVTHLAGAERYWLGDVAAGEPSGRVREAEFRVHGLPKGELVARLEGASRYAHQTLEKFSVEDLGKLRTSPRSGEEASVAWCLLHALEHTALHEGHIQITRQIWDGRGEKAIK